jgi:hypothetical protein
MVGKNLIRTSAMAAAVFLLYRAMEGHASQSFNPLAVFRQVTALVSHYLPLFMLGLKKVSRLG